MKNDSASILIIEDSNVYCGFLELLLKDGPFCGMTFSYVIMETLKDGLEYLGKHLPDLIILDLNLTDSLGIDTFKSVIASFPNSRILIMTGIEDTEMSAEMVRRGALDVYVKGSGSGKQVLWRIWRSLQPCPSCPFTQRQSPSTTQVSTTDVGGCAAETKVINLSDVPKTDPRLNITEK